MTTDNVSIEDAIYVAERQIIWPSTAVMVVPWLAYILAGKLKLISITGNAVLYWFIPVFLGSFIAGWLVWSFRIPKWMLWAYPRVHNLSELKTRAVEAKILWPDGSIFNRTLIMSAVERDQLRDIELRTNEGSRTGSFVQLGARYKRNQHGGFK